MTYKLCARCNGTGRVPDGRRKLSVDDIAEIQRRRPYTTGKELAVEYGVTEATISRLSTADYRKTRRAA